MDEGHQQARRAGLQALLLEDRARRDHAHDLAFEKLLPGPRLSLLADRHRVSRGQEARDVRLRRVRWEAAQRHLVRVAAVASGQREIEDRGAGARILEEHLVEVAEPEEEDGVAVLRLDAQVLCEERAPHTRLRFFVR